MSEKSDQDAKERIEEDLERAKELLVEAGAWPKYSPDLAAKQKAYQDIDEWMTSTF